MASPKTGLQTLMPKDRATGMQNIVSFLNGAGAPMPQFFEELQDLTFADLLAAAQQADSSAMNGKTASAGGRMRAIYARAILRDAQYAAAGRIHMAGLGYHQKLRELYEGLKVDIDVNGYTA